MFWDAISAFEGNLAALREFVDVVHPFLESRWQSSVKSHGWELMPLRMLLEKLAPDFELNETVDEELIRSKFKGEISFSETGDESEKKGVSMSVSGEDADAFMAAAIEVIHGLRYEQLLYESALISLVSVAEVFTSDIIRTYLDEYPDVVGTREPFFSLDELRKFSSIDEVKEQWLEAKVTSILHGSVDDWISFLKTHAKLSMSYLEDDMPRLLEVFERRNVLIHNSGNVNRLYLSKVHPKLTENVARGERLFVDHEYMATAMSLVELNIMLVCAELWKKLRPDDAQRGDKLNDIVFNSLMNNRWHVAEGISRFVMQDNRMSESTRLIGQFNFWLSIKCQGRYETIKTDVEDADFSAKDTIFQLALHAITGREKEFIALLPKVLRSKVLSLNQLDTWPIFREMRDTPRYTKIRNRYERKKS